MPEKKVSFKRFIYSLIDYMVYLNLNNLDFDVGSYVCNEECRKTQFARTKIICEIKRSCKDINFDNRFFLTMSIKDNSNSNVAIEMLKQLGIKFKKNFSSSNCMNILKEIGLIECTKIFVERNNFFAIIFQISNNSTIECIISADSITSKLIPRDEDDEVIEYHYPINQNLKSFTRNIKW